MTGSLSIYPDAERTLLFGASRRWR